MKTKCTQGLVNDDMARVTHESVGFCSPLFCSGLQCSSAAVSPCYFQKSKAPRHEPRVRRDSHFRARGPSASVSETNWGTRRTSPSTKLSLTFLATETGTLHPECARSLGLQPANFESFQVLSQNLARS